MKKQNSVLLLLMVVLSVVIYFVSRTHAQNVSTPPGPVTIASGTIAMTTANIPTGNCGSTVTATATGALSSDTIDWAFNSAVAPSNPAVFLSVVRWPTAGQVNFAYCNPDSASQTPAAATINWSIRRP